MFESKAPTSKTSGIIKDLGIIFSDSYTKKDKIKRLIRNIEYVKRLFTKLFVVVIQYNERGENIDTQKHFLNQLAIFRSLIEENVEKKTQHHSIILTIDDYVSAIREDYKIIRNYVQTLEDINAKIERKVSRKKDKGKIGQLIVRAIEEKIPNFIYFNQNQSPNDDKKLVIVKTFYDHFIKHVSYVRESLGNTFDDNKYRFKLENLQSKLLNTDPVDIDHYFLTILTKTNADRGYSTEILLENLSENPMVHIAVANNSPFYCDQFIVLFEKLKESHIKSSDRKCVEPLSTLVFQFDDASFENFHVKILSDPKLIGLVLKPIYDKGIYLYMNETITTKGNKTDNFRPRASKLLDALKRKFSRLFSLILSDEMNLLNLLKETIIDEKNAAGTYQLLADIHGQCIKHLDFTGEIVNVKYCFNYYYFKALTYVDLDDVSGLPIFCRLLFYIHICDEDKSIQNDSKDAQSRKYTHEHHIRKLKTDFLRVYNEDNHKHLKELVEILRIMINIESFQVRYKSAMRILSYLDADMKNKQKIDVKSKLLEMFFTKNCDKREICLRLAQSFNIHLLKNVIVDKDDILTTLRDTNTYFNLYIEKLADLKHKFNVRKELTPGFSIPYYLSAKLDDDDDNGDDDVGDEEEEENEDRDDAEESEDENKSYDDSSDNVENAKTIMSILFKVFTCSSDKDKQEFLKNQNYVRKEFQNLKASVNRLIQFYDDDDYDDDDGSSVEDNDDDDDKDNESSLVYKELREKSIEYILHGFSGTNEESLTERNEYTRSIIDNFINYRLEHIEQILKSSSKEEIFNMFDIVLKRGEKITLQDWVENTSKLGDKMYFLYCYHKYSENEFDRWFREMNPTVTNLFYDKVKTVRDTVKKELERNMSAFESINIKYLQHNQVGALTLIFNHLEDSSKTDDNLFIKIGTGQGKSLTIAETARKIIELNQINYRPKQQVFIITCYDHLAKRDYENYLNYYKHFNITSMYCSTTSSTKDFENKDVIYLDLETYFFLLRSEGYKTLTESTSLDLPDITNAVLIMDEFDSLILDSDEILQRVYKFDLAFKGDVNNIRTHDDVKKLFDIKFINKFESKFPNTFGRWCDRILQDKQNEDKNAAAKTFQDSLGKETNMAQSFLCGLASTSKAGFVHYYLDPLTFYSKFKRVIGFSGSITESGIHKFKTLFVGKTVTYFEIPPFFGALNLRYNRTFENQPGKIAENLYDFLKAIRDDIRKRHQEQPILIFADSCKRENESKSDYDCIYETLMEAKTSFLRDSTILSIKSEDEINKNIHKIGKLGTITLATRIMGRGADIKVDKNIKKGLHLILTYYPKRENIYIQMLGRTARQDEKGSYSEIVRFEKKFIEVSEVKVEPRIRKLHDTAEYFYRHVSSTSKIGSNWPLFSCLIQYMYTDDFLKYDLNHFIKENIL